MAGYSTTPLIKKLGIKDGMTIRFHNEPNGFRALLGELPKSVNISTEATTKLDLVIFFTHRITELKQHISNLKDSICQNGTLWISWPKKTSTLAGDLSETQVREIGLASGLVDVKVCAIDDDYSGLKFMYRLSDRNPT